MRKVADALPEPHGTTAHEAARRLLVEPEADLLSRRTSVDEVPRTVMAEVRRAVLAGRRLRLRYAASDEQPRWRTVDPIGMVTARGRPYLLATRSGADRTYRLSRVVEAEVLPEPAQRPDDVDLDRTWRERSTHFLAAGDHLDVVVRVDPTRRDLLLETALAVRAEAGGTAGWTVLELTFQDLWHAEWALWQLGVHAEALAPPSLRAALRARATVLAERYVG